MRCFWYCEGIICFKQYATEPCGCSHDNFTQMFVKKYTKNFELFFFPVILFEIKSSVLQLFFIMNLIPSYFLFYQTNLFAFPQKIQYFCSKCLCPLGNIGNLATVFFPPPLWRLHRVASLVKGHKRKKWRWMKMGMIFVWDADALQERQGLSLQERQTFLVLWRKIELERRGGGRELLSCCRIKREQREARRTWANGFSDKGFCVGWRFWGLNRN